MRTPILSLLRPIGIALGLSLLVDGAGREGRAQDRATEARIGTSAAVASIAPAANPFALAATNASKIASHNGVLHLAYLDGSQLKYTTSTDAQTWSAPLILSSSAAGPSLAIASGGVVGVVYVQGGQLYYRYNSGTGWSTPVALSAVSSLSQPSLVAYRDTMHVAFNSGSAVYYRAFPATSPSTLLPDMISWLVLCGTTYVSPPALAIAPVSGSNSQPRVRVAYFQSHQGTGSCSQLKFGLMVGERPATQSSSPWNIIYGGMSSVTGTNTGVSVSMAANPETGDFFVAYSMIFNNAAGTHFLRNASWSAASFPWYSVSLLNAKALVHVAPMECSGFRLAVSDMGTTSNALNPTWYREGTWTGAAGAPSWATAQLPVVALGRSAQPVVWQKHFGPTTTGFTRRMRAVVTAGVGTQHLVQARYDDVNGPMAVEQCQHLRPPPG